MGPIATTLDVLNEMKETVQSIAALKDKLVFVYDENDAADKLKGLQIFPGVAIIYDGLRAMPENKPSDKMGVSAEMVVTIVIVMQTENKFNVDAKSIPIDLLQQLRNIIVGKKSVTNHYWRFIVEAPAKVDNGLAFWVQRWAVPFQTRPANAS